MFGLAKRKPEELEELQRLAKDPAEDYIRLSSTQPPILFWVFVVVAVLTIVSGLIPGAPKHLSDDLNRLSGCFMVIQLLGIFRGNACFVMNSLLECFQDSSLFRNQIVHTTVSHPDAEFRKGLLLQDSVLASRNIKLRKFGHGRILFPFGVVLLAELCKRGAAVQVPGFGDESLSVSLAKQTLDPFVKQRALAWVSSAILLIVGIIGSIWTDYLPRNYLVPLLIVFVLTSVVAALMVSVWMLESKGSFLNSIQATSQNVTIERFGKQPLHLAFAELKSLKVAVRNMGVLGDRVTITAVTHYGRTYVLLSRGTALGFGFLNLLEAAKQKGINIRYLHLQPKADKPRLALELNPISEPRSVQPLSQVSCGFDQSSGREAATELMEEEV